MKNGVFNLPNNFGETGFPVICGSCLMPFGGDQFQYYENQIVFDVTTKNLTKTVGKHQLHFGGRYRRERLSYLPSRQNDSATFDATGTSLENPATDTTGGYSGSLPNTGHTEADLFPRQCFSVQRDIGTASRPRTRHGVGLLPPG